MAIDTRRFNATFSLSPFYKFSYRDSTRKELAEAAQILDLEYRGEGTSIDDENIDIKVRSYLSSQKLKTHALYVNLMRGIINQENKSYIRPPVRYFRDKKGNEPSKKTIQHIEDLYEQMDFNNFMLEIERQTAYKGTILARPAIDPDSGEMFPIKLSPADETLDVESFDNIPSKARELQYETENNDGTVLIHVWDPINYTLKEKRPNQEPLIKTKKPHGWQLSGIPWAVLRYITDSRRFWGPFDGTLLSLCKTRSLLLADTVHRTQVALYEILILAGFTPEEATAATTTRMTGKTISFEYDTDSDDKPVPQSKDVRFESPEGIEPEKVLEIYLQLVRHILDTRGHSRKNFQDSSLVQSAEAQKLADVSITDEQISNKPKQVIFETQWFRLMRWENNRNGGTKIPEDLNVYPDWVPDRQYFKSGSDTADYYGFMLDRNLMAAPDVIRSENPDLSREAAQDKFVENKEFSEENAPPDNQQEPTGEDGNKEPKKG
jgi:hypothetical protein